MSAIAYFEMNHDVIKGKGKINDSFLFYIGSLRPAYVCLQISIQSLVYSHQLVDEPPWWSKSSKHYYIIT